MVSLTVLQTIIQGHIPTLARIVESIVLLPKLIDLFEVFLTESTLHSVQILGDSIKMAGLRNDGSASAHPPLQYNLGRRAASFFGNTDDLFVLQ